ncbi:hypothetical protein ArsFIN_33790 [Arsenophonus nasoniae]|uniref:Uncharacterized protein n=2 Tax=Arsenophonus nasoniae TaxID=638 RepID=A0A4V1BX83_9GAMM|nr:hypothetical protein ArsFIN_33790 [Arsenophonus nasoniae]
MPGSIGNSITGIIGAGLMIAGVIATGGLGLGLIAAGLAVQTAGSLLFQQKPPDPARDQAERKQILRSASASEVVIMGKTVCSGLLFC